MTPSKVLVVDDNHDICDLLALKLTNAGFDVTQANDGLSALELGLSGGFDLVVLDVMMPGMSGIDVLRRLRDAEQTATTPVLLLTAKTQERDVETGFGAGAGEYMTKPFSPRELLVRVKAMLARAQS
jgi:DNA-binding response OmpR family regulator